MKTNNFRRSLLGLAVWAAVGSLSVQGATQNTERASDLEEIIVTASRNQQRVFDSPVFDRFEFSAE